VDSTKATMCSLRQKLQFLVLILYLVTFTVKTHAEICTQSVCEYKWKVRHARTMTYSKDGKTYNVALNGTKLQVVRNELYKNSQNGLFGQTVSPDDVITADGRPRNVIVINDQFPGPSIEVLEGAEVIFVTTSFTVIQNLAL
jgi:hypothetical protein